MLFFKEAMSGTGMVVRCWCLDQSDWARLDVHKMHVCSRYRYRTSGITLCDALRLHPHDGIKLSLVGCSISDIGKVPPSISSKVKTLYLSNNDLLSLRGVEQFKCLQNFSCANNLVRYIGELQWLSGLQGLEKVAFDGNIVTMMPFYREYVLSLCSNVISIDGIKVSAQERRNMRTSARRAQSFYEQLRINELRNCVIHHVSGLLKCHSDLLSFVLGRFRCLRGSHLPSALWGSSATRATELGSVGSVLKQCLYGGVFRWLQIACVDDFDRSVQEMAHKVHLMLLRKMASAERVLLSQSPDAQLAHWDAVTVECLQHQQMICMGLINEFEEVAAVRFGMQSDLSIRKSEWCRSSMNMLQQLHFEPQPSNSEEVLATYCGWSSKCAAEPTGQANATATDPRSPLGVGAVDDDSFPFVRSAKPSSAGSRRASHNSLNRGIGKAGNSAIVDSLGDAGLYPIHTHNPEVQDRYDALLRLMQQQGGPSSGRKKDGIGSGAAKSLSSYLPPQQQEPQDSTAAHHPLRNLDTAQKQSMHPMSLSGDDLFPGVGEKSESTFDPFSEEITFFISAAMRPFNDSLPPAMDQWFQDMLDKAHSADEVELTEQLRMQLWGPVPVPFIRPAAEKTMRGMQRQAEEALAELARRQRTEMLCSQANDRLLRNMEDTKASLRRQLDVALGYLGSIRSDSVRICDDIQVASQWVEASGSMLKTIDAAQQHLESLRGEAEEQRLHSDQCLREEEALLQTREGLLDELSEVSLARHAVEDEMIGDGEMADAISRHLLEDRAEVFRTDKIAATKHAQQKLWLRRMRVRVRRQVRIRRFHITLMAKRAAACLLNCWLAWVRVHRVEQLGRRQVSWGKRRLKQRILHSWQRLKTREECVRALEVRRQQRNYRKAILQWRLFMISTAKRREKRWQKQAFLEDVLLMRVFRAWGKYAAACRPVHSIIDVMGVVRAGRFQKSRVLLAWRDLTLTRNAALQPSALLVSARANTKLLAFVVKQWKALQQALQSDRSRRATWGITRMLKWAKRSWLHAEWMSAAIRRFQVRHQRRSWRRWRLFCKKRKYHRLLVKRVRMVSSWRLIFRTMKTWETELHALVAFRAKDATAIAHYFEVVLWNNFDAWKRVVFGERLSYRKRATATLQHPQLKQLRQQQQQQQQLDRKSLLAVSNQSSRLVSGAAQQGPQRIHSTRLRGASERDESRRAMSPASASNSVGAFKRAETAALRAVKWDGTGNATAISTAEENIHSRTLIAEEHIHRGSLRLVKLGGRRSFWDSDSESDSDLSEQDLAEDEEDNFAEGLNWSFFETRDTLRQLSSDAWPVWPSGTPVGGRRGRRGWAGAAGSRMRACLLCWKHRARRRGRLRGLFEKARDRGGDARRLRCFMRMFHVYSHSLLQRTKAVRAALSDAFDMGGDNGERRKAQLLDSFTSARDKTHDLQRRIDFVSVQLARATGELELVRLGDVDATASREALLSEKLSVEGKTATLCGEIQSIHLLCNSPPYKQAEVSAHGGSKEVSGLDMLGRETPAEDAGDYGGSGGRSEVESGISELQEKKRSLLMHVESVYNRAVEYQAGAMRHQSQLSVDLRDAMERVSESRKSCALLQSRIEQLSEQRNYLEESMEAIAVSVRDSLVSIADMSEGQREQERQLDKEESDLREDMASLVEREHQLRGELDELRAAVLASQEEHAKFSGPLNQVAAEMAAINLFGATRAAAISAESASRLATLQKAASTQARLARDAPSSSWGKENRRVALGTVASSDLKHRPQSTTVKSVVGAPNTHTTASSALKRSSQQERKDGKGARPTSSSSDSAAALPANANRTAIRAIDQSKTTSPKFDSTKKTGPRLSIPTRPSYAISGEDSLSRSSGGKNSSSSSSSSSNPSFSSSYNSNNSDGARGNSKPIKSNTKVAVPAAITAASHNSSSSASTSASTSSSALEARRQGEAMSSFLPVSVPASSLLPSVGTAPYLSSVPETLAKEIETISSRIRGRLSHQPP